MKPYTREYKYSYFYWMACTKEIKQSTSLKSTEVGPNKTEHVINGKNDSTAHGSTQSHQGSTQPPPFEERITELLLSFQNLPLIPNETALNLLKIQSSKYFTFLLLFCEIIAVNDWMHVLSKIDIWPYLHSNSAIEYWSLNIDVYLQYFSILS